MEVGEALTVRLNGTSSSDLVSIVGTPGKFSVSKNYPNPFNPDTKIKFALPEQSHVTIEIYNMLGQHVRTLFDASLGAGYHTVTWNGRNDAAEQLPSGTYFMRLVAGEHTIVQKLMMLK